MTSAEATLSNYTKVRVVRGDLTTIECAAVVSSSGCDLHHLAGVCRAIADACGKSFRDKGQEYVKQNGELKVAEAWAQKAEGKLADHGVEYVIHAIAPAQCPEIKDLVKKTILNALLEADKQQCLTVALPAICSGIMQVPMDVCAECYCSAINAFSQEKEVSVIERIEFVVDNQKAFTEIETVLKRIPVPPPRVLPTDTDDLVEKVGDDLASLSVSAASCLPQSNQTGICAICMDDYADPQTLSCSHTFCRECLAELPSQLCPTCQKPF